jgi:two-component system sensor histidine kinase RpfC
MLRTSGHFSAGRNTSELGKRGVSRVISNFSTGLHRFPEGLRGDYIMGFNRIAAGSLMLVFTLLIGHDTPLRHWTFPILVWVACGLGLLMHLRLAPRLSITRRSLAIVLDVAGATIMMAAGGEATAFLYIVYLWIIIGNGFRFGGSYLFAASFVSTAGFGVLTFRNTFWHSHLSVSLGLMSGLVMLPAYSFALIRQLAKARRDAERADRAKSLFLAGVSHELRTPLNAIVGTAELLQKTRLDASQIEMVVTINNAADGQLSLIQDILEFSQIEVGGARIEIKSFDLGRLLNAVSDVAAVEARKKGLLLNTYITVRTPLKLIGDERHLREVLLNLCGNAIKFTAAGSVTLAADAIDAGRSFVRLRLEVMDTGIGIAPEAQERVFELFTQADFTILDRFGGTGLGLALCKRQIQLLGGSIGVESTLNAGSTFWVSIEVARDPVDEPAPLAADPVALSTDADWMRAMQQRLGAIAVSAPAELCIAFVQEGRETAPPPNTSALIEVVQGAVSGLPRRAIREGFATTVSQQSSMAELQHAMSIAAAQSVKTSLRIEVPEPGGRFGSPHMLAGLRVLVADDNALNRSIVSKMLESAGFHTVYAHDGEQALAVLSSGDVDVALLDVNMPIMNGVETAELYNMSVLNGRRISLIGLTADGSPETGARCRKAGMAVCLVKPVRTAELIDALERAVPDWIANNVVSFKSRSEFLPTLDLQILTDLQRLGGVPFLMQVLENFKLDGSALLAQLEASCLTGDAHRFRSDAHSLCSIGANVGAQCLTDLCRPWKSLSEVELHRDGAMLLVKLRREWHRTCADFDLHVAREHGRPLDASRDK